MDEQSELAPHGFVSLRQYIEARFESIREAVAKSERAVELRFESVNEFRGQLTDQTRTFMPRPEVDEKFKNIEQKVEALQKLLWVGLGIVLALQFLVSIMLVFWKSQK